MYVLVPSSRLLRYVNVALVPPVAGDSRDLQWFYSNP